MPVSRSRIASVLGHRAGAPNAKPGDALKVTVDRLLMDAEGGLAVMSAWHQMAIPGPSAFGPRILLVDGGRIGRRDRPPLIEFGELQRATQPLDPVTAGWPSSVAVEEGHIGADDVVMALDPEAGALGGVGAVVLRATAAEMATAMKKRNLPVVVPDTARVRVDGRLPRWSGPFELALAVLDAVREEVRLTGRVLELTGEAVAGMTVDDRMALCAHLAHARLPALVPPDDATRVWLAARHDGQSHDGVKADPGAEREPDLVLDARKAVLRAARGALTETERLDPTEGEHRPVTQVIVAGRLTELRLATQALSERPLARGVHLVVVPASRRVLVHLIEEGLASQLVRCGAAILPPGAPVPTAPKREVRITTVPTGAADLLVGAAVAGSSAVLGRLIDPEGMRHEVRRGATMR